MPDEIAFPDLILRVRAGDQEAAAELVRFYEPTIRRVIRVRLQDSHLKTVLDSVDICQSVLGNFFVRVAAGQFELQQPEQLIQLLVTMARNKLTSQARKETAQRRDQRRVAVTGALIEELASGAATPSQAMVAREMLDALYQRLSPAEAELVQLRQQGLAWEEIAKRLGEPAQNLRQRLSRTLNRISREIGLDEADDE
jgi:RNA polymerase sigma-70 factor (ECF subfamily)